MGNKNKLIISSISRRTFGKRKAKNILKKQVTSCNFDIVSSNNLINNDNPKEAKETEENASSEACDSSYSNQETGNTNR